MKFIADVMLGKLAKYLRIMGYDTVYFSQKDEDDIIKVAKKQSRILLTKNTRFNKREVLKDILIITEDDPKKQLNEVLSGFWLSPAQDVLFTICIVCNKKLIPITKEVVEGKVPEHIHNAHNTFYSCPCCKRIYWPGSHHKRMLQQIIRLP